jgi:hypothetical protein
MGSTSILSRKRGVTVGAPGARRSYVVNRVPNTLECVSRSEASSHGNAPIALPSTPGSILPWYTFTESRYSFWHCDAAADSQASPTLGTPPALMAAT